MASFEQKPSVLGKKKGKILNLLYNFSRMMRILSSINFSHLLYLIISTISVNREQEKKS